MNRTLIRQAELCLRAGGIIAYPTESVYGLGCDPRNNKAIKNLLELKHRPWQKGLILIAASVEQLYPYIDSERFDLSQPLASWPGPVTWVVPAARGVSHYLKGEHDSIAVRVTGHPLASLLCRTFHGALVSTSANPSNHPPAISASGVMRYFGDEVDFILEGRTGGLEKPTPIYDVRTGDVLRV